MTQPIYIALGANLGNPLASFRRAIAQLEGFGVEIIAISGMWQSPAWPAGQGHPDYINACAQVEFGGDARALLAILHGVEASHGRERTVLNAPRSLDLDLLDFRGEIIRAADIIIPHPRMMDRGFVLLPLSQIAPKWRNPTTNEGIEFAISRLSLGDVETLEYIGREENRISS